MTTKNLTRLMLRVGGVLAIAAAVAVMGGAVNVSAQQHQKEKEKQHEKEKEKAKEKDKEKGPEATPAPPSDPSLSCSCWNGYKQSALLSVLSPTSTPAESYCIADSSTVSLSPDLGVNTLVYAASFCILRVNGVDVGSNFALTAPEAAMCISEATALVPSISWCPQ